MTARRLGNGTLRLLSLSLHDKLIEYEPAPYKTTQGKQFREWDLSKVAPGGELLESFNGFWFEDAKDRL